MEIANIFVGLEVVCVKLRSVSRECVPILLPNLASQSRAYPSETVTRIQLPVNQGWKDAQADHPEVMIAFLRRWPHAPGPVGGNG